MSYCSLHKRWRLCILPRYDANLPKPIRHKESHYFAIFCPCTDDTVSTRFEDFRTLPYVFISVDEGFRALRIMRECTSRHLFLLRKDYLKTTPIIITCVQIATLALLPNDVLTARGERPRPEKRVENAVVRFILGRSSATTTQFRTQVKLTPLDCGKVRLEITHNRKQKIHYDKFTLLEINYPSYLECRY